MARRSFALVEVDHEVGWRLTERRLELGAERLVPGEAARPRR
jgi:hypothetical protein